MSYLKKTFIEIDVDIFNADADILMSGTDYFDDPFNDGEFNFGD